MFTLEEMFGHVVLGLLIMILSGSMIYYSGKLVELFGRSNRADEHLGGTRQMWILIGFGLFVIGGLVVFGVISFTNPTIKTSGF